MFVIERYLFLQGHRTQHGRSRRPQVAERHFLNRDRTQDHAQHIEMPRLTFQHREHLLGVRLHRPVVRGPVTDEGHGLLLAIGVMDHVLGDRAPIAGAFVVRAVTVHVAEEEKALALLLDRHLDLARKGRAGPGSLQDDQLFTVIWFNEGPAELLSGRMLAATYENKREAFAAIKRIVPSGLTEPIDAIKKGLDFKPDVLFLLSDGDFGEDNDRIMQMIRQKNKELHTTINTILFVYDTMGNGERVLRAIAEANQGTFKHVTEKDLQP